MLAACSRVKNEAQPLYKVPIYEISISTLIAVPIADQIYRIVVACNTAAMIGTAIGTIVTKILKNPSLTT